MTLLKQHRQLQGQTLVTKLHYTRTCTVYCHTFYVIVIKAERTAIQYGSMDTVYIFPDENDNLTSYTGGNAQVMVPNGLLQGNVKFDDTQNTSLPYTYIAIYLKYNENYLQAVAKS